MHLLHMVHNPLHPIWLINKKFVVIFIKYISAKPMKLISENVVWLFTEKLVQAREILFELFLQIYEIFVEFWQFFHWH